MKKAVIYARYSCDRQTEQSIEGQLRVCHEFADKNEYEIITYYIDRAASGQNDDRKEFQRMLKASDDREFDYVIVYKLDRFSRNRYDSAINKAALKKNGVKVLSATEQIMDTPEGVILEALLEGFAEYYSAELSQKVKRGIRESRTKGYFTGGRVNFGYRIEERRWVIHEDEARVVRKIFKLFITGYLIKEIVCKIKKLKGVLACGYPVTINMVTRILNNKKYIGIIEGDVVYKNIVPAIVDKKVFEEARVRMAENAKGSGRFGAMEPFILSGNLVCGHCGSLMTGESGTGKSGRVYHYYKCTNRRKKMGCQSKALPKGKIEKLAVDNLLQFLNANDLFDRVSNYYDELKKESPKSNYPKLNREKRNLIKMITTSRANKYNDFRAKKELLKAFVEKTEVKDEMLKLELKIIKALVEVNMTDCLIHL